MTPTERSETEEKIHAALCRGMPGLDPGAVRIFQEGILATAKMALISTNAVRTAALGAGVFESTAMMKAGGEYVAARLTLDAHDRGHALREALDEVFALLVVSVEVSEARKVDARAERRS